MVFLEARIQGQYRLLKRERMACQATALGSIGSRIVEPQVDSLERQLQCGSHPLPWLSQRHFPVHIQDAHLVGLIHLADKVHASHGEG